MTTVEGFKTKCLRKIYDLTLRDKSFLNSSTALAVFYSNPQLTTNVFVYAGSSLYLIMVPFLIFLVTYTTTFSTNTLNNQGAFTYTHPLASHITSRYSDTPFPILTQSVPHSCKLFTQIISFRLRSLPITQFTLPYAFSTSINPTNKPFFFFLYISIVSFNTNT